MREFDGQGIEFGYSCSPTVLDGKVLLPVGGPGASMVALDAADGSVVWRHGDDPASYTPAYPILFRGRSCVLGYLRNALVCHDLQTGERIWRHDLSSGYDEHSAWPIYREPYLWISSPFQSGSELLELTDDPASGTRTVWKSNDLSNDIFSSVLVGGALFGFDLRKAQAKSHRPSRGTFECLDFLSGRVHWKFGDPGLRRTQKPDSPSPPTHVGHASVIVADGKLILFNDTGELILARATTDRYQELARASVLAGDICWTQPTLHGGRLFVRNQSRAACIYLREPEQLQPDVRARLLTTHDIPQKPYVDLAAMILGVEPEYAFDIPSRAWFRNWYIVSNGILVGSLLIVCMACVMRRAWTKRWPNYEVARWLCWSLAFLFGRGRHDGPQSLAKRLRVHLARVDLRCLSGHCRRVPVAAEPVDAHRPRMAFCRYRHAVCGELLRVLLDVSPPEPGDRMGILVWFHGRPARLHRRSVLVPANSLATRVGGAHDRAGIRRLLLVRSNAAIAQELIKPRIIHEACRPEPAAAGTAGSSVASAAATVRQGLARSRSGLRE